MTKRLLPLIALISLCAVAGAQPWAEFKAREAGFGIKFPTKPKTEESKPGDPKGVVTLTSIIGDEVYLVAYNDLPDFDGALPAIPGLLETSKNGFAEGFGGKVVSEQKIKLGPLDALEVMVRDPGGLHARGRIYIIGRRLYQTFVFNPTSNANDVNAKRFLDSFRLLGPADAG
ncbi:MAG: hypothetical protein KIS66_03740 [Fimbriimonadaceae bacterium]|nr:hypothetical protein [Fimbriimonadaceae bacterium]